MIFAGARGSFGAARGGSIRALQYDLTKLGVPVRVTGVLDQVTVDALNNIFEGSVDVPPVLRSGRLTMGQVARYIGPVSKALKAVARGAMTVEAG